MGKYHGAPINKPRCGAGALVRISLPKRAAAGLAGILALLATSQHPAMASSSFDKAYANWMEADRFAPVDYGFGPSVRPPAGRTTSRQTAGDPVPNGGANAASAGVFGAPFAWPIVAIHAALLPDGRVMSFGTDATGSHTGTLVYDVWSPSGGADPAAHLVLPNTTSTDIFCSAQSLLWRTGELLIADGNERTASEQNAAQQQVSVFSPTSNLLHATTPTNFARWYASLIALPNGAEILLGGRLSKGHAVTTPEIYTPGQGWRLLPGAASDAAFNYDNDDWYYPHAFMAADGSLVQIGNDALFSLHTDGQGSVTTLPTPIPMGLHAFPTVYFATGKILALREGAQAVVVDINGATPVVTKLAALSQQRRFANATVLADGTVAITGGGRVPNALVDVAYRAELFNPATQSFTLGASAAKPRLYHSTALLLPDATLITAGGGAPGPVRNLNAEIYYPPYLFAKDGSGTPAVRPVLLSATANLLPGQTLTATLGSANQISRLTFVRFGAATHAQNLDQRFFDLAFSQAGQTLTATLPANANILQPGYYMLFAFNGAGVPSLAKTVLVTN